MISFSGVQAITWSESGRPSRATISEWYRVAWKGLSMSRNRPRPVWITGDVFPCTNRSAGTTLPPNTSPMHWCPRQTPRIGIFPEQRFTTSLLIPAAAGRPGPGEITIALGGEARISSTVISSFRFTTGVSPSSPRYCTRFQVNES